MRVFVATAVFLTIGAQAWAAGSDETLFPHADDAAYWLSGQANIVGQAHPRFAAPYTGPMSLRPSPEGAVSFVGTLFSGFQLTPITEAIIDVEMAAGGGISKTLGLGGFTNLDVVRNPTLSAEPYIARVELRQIIPLTDEWETTPRGPQQIGRRVPVRRLEVWVGKMGTPDFFDHNGGGSDSHLQFLNWAVDNNGAYDYAADTRGFTYGAVLSYVARRSAIRFGYLLMPKVANGPVLDFNVLQAHAENLELELGYSLGGRDGVVRLLGFLNHANMGNYRQAIDTFRNTPDADAACRQGLGRGLAPVIECHREQGRLKGGVGFNFEQYLLSPLRVFGRLGWNDGHNESFAYTEIDSTVMLGLDVTGRWWRREQDRAGVAAVSNGLSDEHRQYLALGGQGFLLGDGMLDYGRENIVEGYYTAFAGHGLSVAADLQFIENPGYNRARGPVAVGAVRLHLEL